MHTDAYRLAAFDPALAPVIAGWAQGADELQAWASLDAADAGPGAFARWHADPEVHPHVLCEGDLAVGYGELWEDAAEDGAELARIIIDPSRRGRGAGRTLVGLLVEGARVMGYSAIWVRVVPSNGPAIACYAAAGFRRTTPDLERSFNTCQPREYVWMRHLASV